MRPTLAEGPETVVEVADQIRFSTVLIDRYVRDAERQIELHEQAQAVAERANRPNLHLAVLGEFCCGKSTFINALIRRRLLKPAFVANTASATVITHGDRFTVRAEFVDGSIVAADERDPSPLRDQLNSFDLVERGAEDLYGLLDQLTSNQDVADLVRRIDVEVPGSGLHNDIAIIDLPGIDAGADAASGHGSVTQRIVEETADAAIVLIPSSSPMTAALLSFLGTQAQHFLHRCLFVVTAMDRHSDDERLEILSFVRRQLRQKFQLDAPIVIDVSALAVLHENVAVDGRREAWLGRFYELESMIRSELIHQREVIFSEGLIRLLQHLTHELQRDVERNRRELADEAVLLEKTTVTELRSILELLLVDGTTAIEAAGTNAKRKISARRGALRDAIELRLNKLIKESGWALYQDYSDHRKKIRRAVEDEAKDFVALFNKDLKPYRKACGKASRRFAEGFEEHYVTLEALGVAIPAPTFSKGNIELPSVSFDAPKSYVDKVKGEDEGKVKAGAIVGGVLGFLVGGPVGAAAGAALGAGGGGAAGVDLSDFQAQIRRQLKGDVGRFADKLIDSVRREVDRAMKAAIRELDRTATAHAERYESAVEAMIVRHREKGMRLQKRIALAEEDSRDLVHRQQRLERQRARLLDS